MRLKRWQQSRARKNFLKSFFSQTRQMSAYTQTCESRSVTETVMLWLERWGNHTEWHEDGKKEKRKEAKSERRSFAWKNRFIVFHWKWIIFSNYVSIAFFLFLLYTPPTPLTALIARASISPSFLNHSTAQQRTITYLKFARNSTKRIYLYIPFRIIFFHFTFLHISTLLLVAFYTLA